MCSTSVFPLMARRAVSSRPTQNCIRLMDMTSAVCSRRYSTNPEMLNTPSGIFVMNFASPANTTTDLMAPGGRKSSRSCTARTCLAF